ncbi:hypothetical protein FGA82_17895 [Pseudomonas fluorescens]|uniref:hypothetical protein n=1 Tax=Pseudomonas fluorescens TaxID=294 RepID=UPI001132113D|nr:hypothetical protein [Pseudomonas fluorescens]TMU77496.1 hypothetical protein FGA82_17895 [Pseudomonas fluorescens]
MSANAVTVCLERDPSRPLLAFWVGKWEGERNVFAAEDAEQALAMARAYSAAASDCGLADVRPVSADALDAPMMGAEPSITLRARLQAARRGGWLGRGVWVTVDLLGDVPAAAPLRAFWVGEHDVYAAHTPEQALELCEGHSGMPETFDLDDVRELTADELDKPLTEEDGTPCGTTRQMLADKTEPGELVSFE